jgi:hypothetical protein
MKRRLEVTDEPTELNTRLRIETKDPAAEEATPDDQEAKESTLSCKERQHAAVKKALFDALPDTTPDWWRIVAEYAESPSLRLESRVGDDFIYLASDCKCGRRKRSKNDGTVAELFADCNTVHLHVRARPTAKVAPLHLFNLRLVVFGINDSKSRVSFVVIEKGGGGVYINIRARTIETKGTVFRVSESFANGLLDFVAALEERNCLLAPPK